MTKSDFGYPAVIQILYLRHRYGLTAEQAAALAILVFGGPQ
jgi:hypothetical protein